MKNKMKEVAQLLGVELNEEFKIKGFTLRYHITEIGLYDEHCSLCHNTLIGLLRGDKQIEKIPYKPKCGEKYYSPSFYKKEEDDYCICSWDGCSTDYARYRSGLVFRTSQEALEIGIPRLKEIIKEYNENV